MFFFDFSFDLPLSKTILSFLNICNSYVLAWPAGAPVGESLARKRSVDVSRDGRPLYIIPMWQICQPKTIFV